MEKMDSGQSIYLDLSISRQNENGEAVSGCASAGDNDSTEWMDRMKFQKDHSEDEMGSNNHQCDCGNPVQNSSNNEHKEMNNDEEEDKISPDVRIGLNENESGDRTDLKINTSPRRKRKQKKNAGGLLIFSTCLPHDCEVCKRAKNTVPFHKAQST